jgi:hypothetical protein
VNLRTSIDPETLAEEIARYLDAIDAFRAAGCEPSWHLEVPPLMPATKPAAQIASPRIAH